MCKEDNEIIRNLRNSIYSSIDFLKKNRILDIGCGTGEFILELEGEEGELIGLEPWRTQIRIARNKSSKADFIIGIGEHLPFVSSSFTIVHAAFVLEHIKEQEYFLNEISRVISNNGKLIIISPNSLSFHGKLVQIIPIFMRNLILRLLGSDAVGKFSEEEILYYKFCSISRLDKFLKEKGFKKILSGKYVGKSPFHYNSRYRFIDISIKIYWRIIASIVEKTLFRWMAPTFVIIFEKSTEY